MPEKKEEVKEEVKDLYLASQGMEKGSFWENRLHVTSAAVWMSQRTHTWAQMVKVNCSARFLCAAQRPSEHKMHGSAAM